MRLHGSKSNNCSSSNANTNYKVGPVDNITNNHSTSSVTKSSSSKQKQKRKSVFDQSIQQNAPSNPLSVTSVPSPTTAALLGYISKTNKAPHIMSSATAAAAAPNFDPLRAPSTGDSVNNYFDRASSIAADGLYMLSQAQEAANNSESSRPSKDEYNITTESSHRKHRPEDSPPLLDSPTDHSDMQNNNDPFDTSTNLPSPNERGRRSSTKKMSLDEKRRNNLERNRQAALKCRQRKKRWLSELQSKVAFYSTENNTLTQQVNQLHEEVMSLRNILAAHRECNVARANNNISLQSLGTPQNYITASPQVLGNNCRSQQSLQDLEVALHQSEES